jgi:predicted outer membrane repeat protein
MPPPGENNNAAEFGGGLYAGAGMTPQEELAGIARQIAQAWGRMVKRCPRSAAVRQAARTHARPIVAPP